MDKMLDIVRYLGEHPEKRFTMHQLSVAIGMPYATFYRTLRQMGDLVVQERVGKAVTVRLNTRQPLLKHYLPLAQARLSKTVILQTLSTHGREIKRHGVRRIGLFGSFLKGTQHPGSDLDFLVAFQKPTFDNYIELKFLLEKLFHRKVDLVTEDSLKPAMRYVKGEVAYAEGL